MSLSPVRRSQSPGQWWTRPSLPRVLSELQEHGRQLHVDTLALLPLLLRRALQRHERRSSELRRQAAEVHTRLSSTEIPLAEDQRLGLLQLQRELQLELAHLLRAKQQLQASHIRTLRSLPSTLDLQASSDLNYDSALFFAPLNLCALGELGLELWEALEGHMASRYAQSERVLQGVRKLVAETVEAMPIVLPLVTQQQVDQLCLSRRLLSLGEYSTLLELMQRGLSCDLNPDTGLEWTALQRWCLVDSPVDHRFLLLFFELGLDPSDAPLAHGAPAAAAVERPSALQLARAVAQQPEAARVQPTAPYAIMRFSPRSAMRARLDEANPFTSQSMHRAGAAAVTSPGPAGSGDSDAHATVEVPSHVRFSVELLAAWEAHSVAVRLRLAGALSALGHGQGPQWPPPPPTVSADPAAAAVQPASAPAINLTAVTSSTVPPVVLQLVSEYLDMRTM